MRICQSNESDRETMNNVKKLLKIEGKHRLQNYKTVYKLDNFLNISISNESVPVLRHGRHEAT